MFPELGRTFRAEQMFPELGRTDLPPNRYIICNKEGVQKLIAIRIAQWERTKKIKPKEPIPGEDCARHETKVVFFEVAQEYFFPYEAEVFTEEPNGKYPCPWDSDKRCINFYGPVMQYVKAQYLDLNKEWQEGVFIEAPGDIRFIDHPDDVQEEGRSPDSLSQSALQAKFLVTLVEN